MIRYQFTQEQLCKVIADTLDMYLEYVDVHGHDRVRAAMAAIDETVQGLDAEKELADLGEVTILNQLPI
jgi:hypothetical protein